MERVELFMNGVGVMAIINNEFYIENEEYGWECYTKVSKNDFIKELKEMSWVCLTSWCKEIRDQYLKLVECTKNIK